MDKNTILAVILSTVVVIASITLQSIFSQKNRAPTTDASQATASQKTQDTDSTTSTSKQANQVEAEKEQPTLTANQNIEEQTITVETGVATIVLTNHGGDMTSYKLDPAVHFDTDTNDGVEMVTNLTDTNRAFGVAMGGPATSIIGDLFKTEQKTNMLESTDGKRRREHIVLFTREYDGFVYGKRYTFIDGEYMFRLEILFKATGSLDKQNIQYTLRTAPQIGPHFNPKVDKYENRQFISFDGDKAKKINITSSKQYKQYTKDYVWQGIAGKYFASIVIPALPDLMEHTYYSTALVKTQANAQAFLVRKEFELEKGSGVTGDTRGEVRDVYFVYCGPRNEKSLKVYNEKTTNGFGLSNQKLNYALQTSGWLGWLETILKVMLETINKVAHNWGVSIILLTIIIKLLLFPLTKKQSMGTLKMQEIQPKVQELQAKYKDEPQKLQEAMAKVYKDAGYNPASGCLPLILQFLILFAMYNLFNNYFEFRGKGFIPGWINDLTTGDTVHTFTRDIPFFGSQLRILPIIYLISQLLFGKITGNGGTAAPSSSKTQMNLMMYGMPLMFFFLFYNAPSGLLLYWTVSNIFQMVQQVIINRALKQKRAEMAQSSGPTTKSGTKPPKKRK